MHRVDWQPWQTAAFLDAQRRRRPVLLLLETAWSPACLEAHANVFARPEVARAIADTAVPVRVDADRRPDIADRYALGAWPSLLVLTPEGHVLTGGTRLDASLAGRLREVALAFRAHDGAPRGCVARPAEPAAVPMDLDPAAASNAVAAVLWQARAPDGTFLTAGLPCATATLAALARAAGHHDPAWAAAAATTLDRLPESADGLVTPFGRLDVQADWVRTLARAVRVEPDHAWVGRLDRALEALRRVFRRPDAHWRPWIEAPDLVLVDASARACRALLAAADVLQRPELAQEAIEALEVLAPEAYVRASGVSHVLVEAQPRGPMLLDDAMHLAHALLDADRWRADDVYRDLADELLQTSRARLQDGTGGLQDRRAALAGAGQVGRLAEPLYPLVGNALAAVLARRLRGATDTADASRWLGAVSPQALAAGVHAAPVVLAWEALGAAGDVIAAW